MTPHLGDESTARALALPRPRGLGWAASVLERATALDTLLHLYDTRPARLTPAAFVRFALDALGLRYHVAFGTSQDIPRQGGLIIVSNHPFGASDGLVLADLLLSIRSDVLLLANTVLRRVPELAPLISPIVVFRAHANLGAVRSALKHLQRGGVLVLFPSGEVSRLELLRRRVADPPWKNSAALLAYHSGASVLPVHIAGTPRWSSLMAGALHPRLRTLMLGRDLIQQRDTQVSVYLGQPIPAAELGRLEVPARTAYLRLLSESLAPAAAIDPAPTYSVPVANEPPADTLAAEVQSLPPACRLCLQGPFEVFCTSASSIPNLLLEIGRLRELSFRQVQEGTGHARDLDAFDAHYQHLFVWHREQRRVIGAYRLGFTESLTRQRHVAALYSSTLFEYGPPLLAHIGPAIELGRSFVRPEWQRNFRALRLLWSGIAVLLDRHPEIRCLFGPVSISASYSPLARTLMEAALSTHHGDDQLRTLVAPRAPVPRAQRAPDLRPVIAALSDPELLSRMVARLDRGSGMPVLLRHYVQLKGRFAGFSEDAQFGNTLDGLVFVRVEDIPPAMRAKFGAQGRPPRSADGNSSALE